MNVMHLKFWLVFNSKMFKNLVTLLISLRDNITRYRNGNATYASAILFSSRGNCVTVRKVFVQYIGGGDEF